MSIPEEPFSPVAVRNNIPTPIGIPCLRKHVGVYVFNPVFPVGKPVTATFNWYNPHFLALSFAEELYADSGELIDYHIKKYKELDLIPQKEDGFVYTPEELDHVLHSNGQGHHEPDIANYDQALRASGAMQDIELGIIDEVWFFGFPFGGFYESRECGGFSPRRCNSGPLDIPNVKNFFVMGFNYQRGLPEMLEDYGHRAEALLENTPGFAGWTKEFGTVHRLPQDTEDYYWQGMSMLEHHTQWLVNLKPEWWPIIR